MEPAVIHSLLPARNAEKAIRLIEAPIALRGAFRAVMAEEEDAKRRKANAEREVANRAELMRTKGRQKHEDGHTAAVDTLETVKAELQRKTKAAALAAVPYHSATALAEAIRSFLAVHRHGILHGLRKPFRDRPIKAERIADPQSALEKLRASYPDIAAEVAAIEAAPRPIAEIQSRIVEAVDAIAAKGEPGINLHSADGDPSRLADRFKLSIHRSGSLVGDGGASFICWLLRDELVAKLTALAPDDIPGALTDDERDRALKDLAAHRIELERREEAIILGAEQRGIMIARRPDADPYAILEIEA